VDGWVQLDLDLALLDDATTVASWVRTCKEQHQQKKHTNRASSQCHHLTAIHAPSPIHESYIADTPEPREGKGKVGPSRPPLKPPLLTAVLFLEVGRFKEGASLLLM
jgi:hypothetical protein